MRSLFLNWDGEFFIVVRSSGEIRQNKNEFFCNICLLFAFNLVVFKSFEVFFERPSQKS